MKTLNNFLLISLTIWVTSCRFQGFSQPFETTVQVTDMDGKPIASRTVRLAISLSDFIDTTKINQELVTNNEGKAIFNYDLSISDSNQDFANFFCKDDNTWKAIGYEDHHSLSNKQSKIIKNKIQLKMDSLKPLKIRLSSNRNDLIHYSISSFFNTSVIRSPQDYKLFKHDLDLLERDRRASSLDTTFTVKIFSKHSFAISATTGYNSEPKIWPYQTIFTDKMNRDSIYWIKLL